MRILVTGAGGFVGGHVTRELLSKGHDVIAVWRQARGALEHYEQPALSLHQVDLRDTAAVEDLLRSTGDLDAIVHAAAQVPGGVLVPDSGLLLQAAAEDVGSLTTLIRLAALNPSRFVFTSSISVYGGTGATNADYREPDVAPNSYYAWAKLACESLLDVAAGQSGAQAVSLRLAGAHGIGRTSGVLHTFATRALSGEDILIHEANSRFRPVFVDDVVQAVCLAVETPQPSGHSIYNIASSDSFDLPHLAGRIIDLSGSTSKILTAEEGIGRNEVMNIDLAVAALGFAPQTLDNFLPGYLEALRRL